MVNLFPTPVGLPSPPLSNHPPTLSHQSSMRIDPDTSPATLLVTLALGISAVCAILSYLESPLYFQLLSLLDMAQSRLRSSKRLKTYGGNHQLRSAANAIKNLAKGKVIAPQLQLKKTWRRGPDDAPPGLHNLHATCYQNSVMQGLASLPSFTTYLDNLAANYPELNPESTSGALCTLIQAMNNPENNSLTYIMPVSLRVMSSYEQQDAQEYYATVFTLLENEVKKALADQEQSAVDFASAAKAVLESPAVESQAKEEEEGPCERAKTPAIPKPIANPNPLEGLMAQRVACIRCGHSDGLSFIPFNCLTVPLPNDEVCDVQDCLDNSMVLEKIEGMECAKCTLLKAEETLTRLLKAAKLPQATRAETEKRLQKVQQALEADDFSDNQLKECGVSKNKCNTTKTRQNVVGRAPKSLVVHTNRSVFDDYTGAQLKNHARVTFPKELDLGKWCLGAEDDSLEQWPKDPTKSMLTRADGQGNPTIPYVLRAAVVHHGRHSGGHYICYSTPVRHDGETPEWWLHNDDDTESVTEDEVLGTGAAFMLFYEKVDKPAVAKAADEVELPVEEVAPAVETEVPVEEEAPAVPKVTVETELSVEEAASVPLPETPSVKGKGRKRSFDTTEGEAAPSHSSSPTSELEQTDLWSNAPTDDKTEPSEVGESGSETEEK